MSQRRVRNSIYHQLHGDCSATLWQGWEEGPQPEPPELRFGEGRALCLQPQAEGEVLRRMFEQCLEQKLRASDPRQNRDFPLVSEWKDGGTWQWFSTKKNWLWKGGYIMQSKLFYHFDLSFLFVSVYHAKGQTVMPHANSTLSQLGSCV